MRPTRTQGLGAIMGHDGLSEMDGPQMGLRTHWGVMDGWAGGQALCVDEWSYVYAMLHNETNERMNRWTDEHRRDGQLDTITILPCSEAAGVFEMHHLSR